MNRTLYEMKEINSSQLLIPRELYQRNERKRKIESIIANFDERVANEPKVSFRDGQYFVFDGQHTVLAREQMQGDNVSILCKVYNGLTAQDEAHLFAIQTGTSSKPTSGSILRAKMFSGDSEAIAFYNATEASGIAVALNGEHYDGHLTCINTAMREYRKLGEKRYKESMSIIADAWDGQPDSLRYEIIKAVCEFIHVYHDKYDRKKLVIRLAKTDPMRIVRDVRADMDTPSDKKYLLRVFEIYNGNSRTATLPLLF